MLNRKISIQILALLLFLLLLCIGGFILSILLYAWITIVVVAILTYFGFVINIYLINRKVNCWRYCYICFLELLKNMYCNNSCTICWIAIFSFYVNICRKRCLVSE